MVGVFGTAIAEIIITDSWNNKVRALCDGGSEVNLITLKTIKRLGIKRCPISLNLMGAQDTKINDSMGRVVLNIKNPYDETHICGTFYVVRKITRNTPTIKIDQS